MAPRAQMPNALTKAVNSEMGTFISRVFMYMTLPGLTVLGFLINNWVTTPQAALSARLSVVEALAPEVHQDELSIAAMQSSITFGRQDRLAAADDTKAALSTLNAKTDQLQSSVSTVAQTLAGVAATLDILKQHNVASLNRTAPTP